MTLPLDLQTPVAGRPAVLPATGQHAGTPTTTEQSAIRGEQDTNPTATHVGVPVLDFYVFGRPAQQGSKSATMRGGRAIIFEDNKRTEPWRQAVVSAARQAMPTNWQRIDKPTPVGISLLCTFDRPATAPKRRRYWQTTRTSGDWDKILRSTFDALTAAGVWQDDSQVVRLFEPLGKTTVGDLDAMKIPGAHVRIYVLSAFPQTDGETS